MLESGCIIDMRYKVMKLIGIGGSSHVFEVMNIHSQKRWAMKVIAKTALVENGGNVTCVAEVAILKTFRHSSLPELIDYLEDEKYIYMIMTLINGCNLKEWLQNQEVINFNEMKDMLLQICDVLSYLHAHHMIYRDLKPSNLMVCHNQRMMLIDFGTVRIYEKHKKEDTIYLGTPGFAAPEQYGFGQTNVQTDIYGFGAVLYYMIFGKEPEQPLKTVINDIDSEYIVSINDWIPIIEKCMAVNQQDRYQNIVEVREDIMAASVAKKKGTNNQLQKILLSTLLILIIGVVAYSWHNHIEMQEKLSEYTMLLEDIQTLNADRRKDAIKKAILFMPDQEDAYLILCEGFREDGYFDQKEEEFLLEILYDQQNMDNETVFSIFKQYPDTYVRLAYEFGNLYYFYRPFGENRRQAYEWFNKIDEIDDKKIKSEWWMKNKEQISTQSNLLKQICALEIAFSRHKESGVKDIELFKEIRSKLEELCIYEMRNCTENIISLDIYRVILCELYRYREPFLITEVFNAQSMNQLVKKIMKMCFSLKPKCVEEQILFIDIIEWCRLLCM